MRFELFVASRYLRGKRKNRFVSLITLISVAGVSVGVIALIVVMSVMTGFDNAFRDTIIGNRSHLTLRHAAGWTIDDPEQLIEKLEQLCPEIQASGPIIELQGILVQGGHTEPAFIIGIDPEREQDVTDLAENLTTNASRRHGRGELPKKKKDIVLGYRLAERLGVHVGSDLAALTYKPTARALTGIRAGTPVWLTVSGISHAKMSDFDSYYAFTGLPTARMLTGRNGVDGIHMKLKDPMTARAVADRIEQTLPQYIGTTWYESQEAFFGALEQEKVAMFIILVFIVLVAAFNITSTLIMIVMEKRQDIGILQTLGVSSPSILILFMLEGLMIGLSGTLIGVALGTLLAYNLNPVAEWLASLFNVPLFDSTIYYFDGIPVDVVPRDIATITLAAIALTFLSTLYPAWSASRLNPVDALRYE